MVETRGPPGGGFQGGERGPACGASCPPGTAGGFPLPYLMILFTSPECFR